MNASTVTTIRKSVGRVAYTITIKSFDNGEVYWHAEKDDYDGDPDWDTGFYYHVTHDLTQLEQLPEAIWIDVRTLYPNLSNADYAADLWRK